MKRGPLRLVILGAAVALLMVTALPLRAQKLPESKGIDFDAVEYVPSETDADPELEKAILAELPGYGTQEEDEDGMLTVRYFYNRVDLNGDRKPEVLVYLNGSYTCGSGGCTALIFRPSGQGYRLISSISLVHHPIIVSKRKTRRWSDLITYVAGGGARGRYALLRWNGRGYPSNASDALSLRPRSRVTGKALIADDITPDCGIELRPAKAR